jgi:hypothetical protein
MINNSAPDWLLAAAHELPIGPDLWCQGLHSELGKTATLVPSRFRVEHWMVPIRESERDALQLASTAVIPDRFGPDPDRPGDRCIFPGVGPENQIWPVSWHNNTSQYHAMIQVGHVTSTVVVDHANQQLQTNWSTGSQKIDQIEEYWHWVDLHIPVNSQFLDYYSGRMMLSMFRYAVEHNNSRLYLSESGWGPPKMGTVLLDHETRPLVAILSLISGQVQYYYVE